MVTITRGLLSVLRERAADRDPDTVNVALDATPAGELDWRNSPDGVRDLDQTTPVLTHFYLPEAGASVSAVFGMDLGRPSGAARFLSHPDGRQTVTETDDLAASIFVATPPYEESDIQVYDRRGRRQPLRIVDAVPPEESLADPSLNDD
ncbi:MAG: hypothetical protein J07HB67_02104 [halophilic archaeon J07HB67]|nr:MAG: hypothetical protein J07HB67_02104 [halophilic archaeon J07HB67]